MSLQVFQYQNSPITFNLDGEMMINASQMAKPFGKKTTHFVENSQTQEFIRVLESKVGIPTLVTNHGGNNPGTWMHQKLALKFAGWLSPEFELWVYDRVEELLTTGKTELQPKSDAERIAEGYKLLMIQVEQVKEQLQLAETTIKQQAPVVEYATKVLSADGGIASSVVADDFGKSAIWLHGKLKEKGAIWKVNGCWILTSKYKDKGYSITKTFPYTDSHGEIKTSHQTYWTEAGRKFIHDFLSEFLPKKAA